MSDTRLPLSELHELLAERALFGLSDVESQLVERELEVEEASRLALDYELLAATLDPALTSAELAPLPAHIADAARRSAVAPIDPELPGVAADEVRTDPVIARIRPLPWIVAAASLAIAATAVFLSGPRAIAPMDLAQQRDLLLAEPASVSAAWQSLEDASVGSWSDGDVVWDGESQTGYMRFVGLAPNDPDTEQYQLWIFDSARSDAHPVDGGVFDVTSSGDVIVQIHPKLHVSDAVAFAITVEKPGGVVVSDRSRLALLAPIATGDDST